MDTVKGSVVGREMKIQRVGGGRDEETEQRIFKAVKLLFTML